MRARKLWSATLLLAAACGPMRSGDNPFAEGGEGKNITIEVRNNNFNDATVHALFAGNRRRLGLVPSYGEKSYSLAWPASWFLTLEIDVRASGTCRTAARPVNSGEIVKITIDAQINVGGIC